MLAARNHAPQPLLDGVRGRPALCKARALVENLIQRLSMMLADLPEIRELDLNAVLAFADSVCAVDGRIRSAHSEPT
ncbi:MAG: acetate--CoA ligase family protein [Ideonella sp.]|nr:acetate--CoA ligase family protein [Ideonella sp.]